MEVLRGWISKNIAAVMFLGMYFVSVVLGNLISTTSFGRSLLESSGYDTRLLDFPTTFTFGYWLLLFLPLLTVPVAVYYLRPILKRRLVLPIVNGVPDFRPIDYVAVLIATYAVVFWALWHTDAFALMANATTGTDAIEARFTLQARMTFPEKIVIHAILPMLSFYSVVAAFKDTDRRLFWSAIAVLNVMVAFVTLVLINMKWPVLVFLLGIVSAIFVFSKRYAYVKAAIGLVTVVALYLLISTYVFRFVAPPQPDAPPPSSVTDQTESPAKSTPFPNLTELTDTSAKNTPFLLAHMLNRMAVTYPYYYKIFTEEGPVCGTLVQHLMPGAKPCHPTYLVYSRIFPNDGYTGRGSSPQGPHITAYAMGGWLGAFIAMFGACLLVAAFSAIPLNGGVMAGTFTVIGAVTGYHLSQVPGDGVIIYDHGLLWPLLLAAGYAGYRWLYARTTRIMGKGEQSIPYG